MTLYYIENFEIPGTVAHTLQVINNLNEIDKLRKITLISYSSGKSLPGIKHIHFKRPRFFNKIIPLSVFHLVNKMFSRVKFSKNDDVITRNPMIALLLRRKVRKIVLEIHDLPSFKLKEILNFFVYTLPLKLLKNKKGIEFVVISNGLKKDLSKSGYNSKRITILEDGVNMKDFDLDLSISDARKELSLPINKKIFLYAGSLQNWKGYDTFLKSSIGFKDDKSVEFLILGGTKKQLSILKKDYPWVSFIPFVDSKEVPKYLKAANYLALPNSGKFIISSSYTSPLKLFEYMAAKRLIISSDLPSIRHVLDDNDAFFFIPDSPKSLAKTLNLVLQDKTLEKKKIEASYKKVKNFTWAVRAKKMLDLF